MTALSSDVAGFTALADQIDPESLSQTINEYILTLKGLHKPMAAYEID